MYESLWPQGLQHARLPCPSPTPGACSNSCPLSWWCHPTISSSVIPFSSCLQCFPASGFSPVSQFFATGDQIIGVSTSASVLPMNIQGWSPLGLTGLISLLSKGLSRGFFSATIQKHQFFGTQPSLWSNSYLHTWLLEKLTLTMQTLLVKWCLCFLICCLVCQSFLSKEQASFNFMAAVTIHSDFGAQENEICQCFSPLFAMK